MRFKLISSLHTVFSYRNSIRDFYNRYIRNSPKPHEHSIQDNRSLEEIYKLLQDSTEITVNPLKEEGDFYVYRLDYDGGESDILKIVSRQMFLHEKLNSRQMSYGDKLLECTVQQYGHELEHNFYDHMIYKRIDKLKFKLNKEKLISLKLSKQDSLDLYVNMRRDGDGYFCMQKADGDLEDIRSLNHISKPFIKLKETGKEFEIVEANGSRDSQSTVHDDIFLYKLFIKLLFLVYEFHEMGYVHTDIKLSNMVYFGDINEVDISLIDFADAYCFDDSLLENSELYSYYYDQLRDCLGTPEFLAPEFKSNRSCHRHESWAEIPHISNWFEQPVDDSDSEASLCFTSTLCTHGTDDRRTYSTIRDFKHVFQKRDLYALGMVLFGLLFNTYPFELPYSRKQKSPSSIYTYKLIYHKAVLECLKTHVEKQTSKSPLYNVIYNLLRIEPNDRVSLDIQLFELIERYNHISGLAAASRCMESLFSNTKPGENTVQDFFRESVPCNF